MERGFLLAESLAGMALEGKGSERWSGVWRMVVLVMIVRRVVQGVRIMGPDRDVSTEGMAYIVHNAKPNRDAGAGTLLGESKWRLTVRLTRPTDNRADLLE